MASSSRSLVSRWHQLGFWLKLGVVGSLASIIGFAWPFVAPPATADDANATSQHGADSERNRAATEVRITESGGVNVEGPVQFSNIHSPSGRIDVTVEAPELEHAKNIKEEFGQFLKSEIVGHSLVQSRSKVRQDEGFMGHETLFGSTITPIDARISDGEIMRIEHRRPHGSQGSVVTFDELDADLTLRVDFEGQGFVEKRARFGTAKVTIPQFNDDNSIEFKKSQRISGTLTLQFRFHRIGAIVDMQAVTAAVAMNSKDRANTFARETVIPNRLLPHVMEALRKYGIAVPNPTM